MGNDEDPFCTIIAGKISLGTVVILNDTFGYLCQKQMIMNTLTIELTNPKAINLLTDLAELNLIKFIDKEPIDYTHRPKLSSLLRGSISAQAADEFNKSIEKSRNEWTQDI